MIKNMFYIHTHNFDIGLCACISLCVVTSGGYPQRQEEDVGVPGCGVNGSCELPDMDSVNRAQAHCKGSEHSQSLSHLSSHNKESVCVYLSENEQLTF